MSTNNNLPKAGEMKLLTSEQIKEFYKSDSLPEELDIYELLFALGFVAALEFYIVSSDAEMYGESIGEYYKGAFCSATDQLQAYAIKEILGMLSDDDSESDA